MISCQARSNPRQNAAKLETDQEESELRHDAHRVSCRGCDRRFPQQLAHLSAISSREGKKNVDKKNFIKNLILFPSPEVRRDKSGIPIPRVLYATRGIQVRDQDHE
jgi:hypothetical protein